MGTVGMVHDSDFFSPVKLKPEVSEACHESASCKCLRAAYPNAYHLRLERLLWEVCTPRSE
jgi:hypothetical protein